MSFSRHADVWVDVAQALGEQEFLARYPGYFLLSSGEPGELVTINDTDVADLGVEPPRPRHIRKLELLWIANELGGPNLERITVGRASTCNIVLRAPGVSKLHAVFRARGEMLTVTDLGSRNGTQINGKALAPHRAQPVDAHDRIQFSAVKTMLIDARELCFFLSRVR